MTLLETAFAGKSVLVTGDTGFKGAWLSEWMVSLGARVFGLALPAEPDSLFSALSLQERVDHVDCDVRDYSAVAARIDAVNPDFVFHLAAQALVRDSYDIPRDTFETNVTGTLNVLEAIRQRGQPCRVVVVSTDKCYENREWAYAYREADAMGGHDPYSASKGCVEVLTSSYNRSFFNGTPIRCATARAGNVIGAGDWAKDRIVPDMMRAVRDSFSASIRNPNAIRPWQHVLEPVSGYMILGARLDGDDGESHRTAYNFGPRPESAKSVGALVGELAKHCGDRLVANVNPDGGPHEAQYLKLAIDKAVAELGWAPVWDFKDTIRNTWEGYDKLMASPATAAETVRGQISQYTADARSTETPWITDTE